MIFFDLELKTGMIIIKEEKTKLKHKKSDKEVWRGGSSYGEATGTLVGRKGLEMEGR